MTTEQKDIIESLEARIAAMTRPCSQSNSFHEGLAQLDDHLCKECKGEGVVPLIAGSRRECPTHAQLPRIEAAIRETGLEQFIDFEKGRAAFDDCPECNGFKYIPDLDGMKVLAWMFSEGGWVVSSPISLILKLPEDEKGFYSSDDLYEALLRACLASKEALEAEA